MHRIFAGLLLVSFMAACGSNNETVTEIPSAVPFRTPTLTRTSTVIPPQTEIFLPTPTTFTYTIVQGDTLTGIAARFGVTLEALTAANPAVQPSTLQPGATIIIPTGSQQPGEPTPTPASLPIVQARCWPEAGGGLWCFAQVQNPYSETLENLSAQFSLLGANEQVLASQVAYGLLDILPAGQTMPLAIHFPPPVPASAGVRVQMLTAIRLLPGDTRYLPVMLEDSLVEVSASGLSAQVSGRAIFTGTTPASTLWVLATAYDAAGDVVGVRRWDSSSPLTAEDSLTFDFLVSSLGPPIERVDFLVEARP